MKKYFLPGIILLIAILGAVTLTATAPTLEPSSSQPVPKSVRAIVVQPQPITLTVNSQGTVIPAIQSDLVPEVSGRVVHMSPAMIAGGFFNEGELLLELDSADYEAAVSRASASLTRAEAELEHARFELQRQQELKDRELSSQSVLESAQRTFRVAEATEKDARVSLAQARRDLSRTRITAPFTGLVRSEQVDIGQFVSRGTSMAKIYATDFVEVRLPLADRQLAYLNLPLTSRGRLPESQRPGVTLHADYAGQRYTWSGEIIRTESEIDLKSRMVNVVARIDNNAQPAPLNVGMYVEADIEGVLVNDVVVLPRNTLRNGNQVLVIDNENRMHYRTVELLRLYQDEVLIKSGLEANERVCTTTIQTVVDGMLVDPLIDSPITGTAGNDKG